MKFITVKELREKIDGIPDDSIIWIYSTESGNYLKAIDVEVVPDKKYVKIH